MFKFTHPLYALALFIIVLAGEVLASGSNENDETSRQRRTNENYINKIPDDLLVQIFSYLSIKDLCELKRVSKKMNEIAHQDILFYPIMSRASQMPHIDSDKFKANIEIAREYTERYGKAWFFGPKSTIWQVLPLVHNCTSEMYKTVQAYIDNKNRDNTTFMLHMQREQEHERLPVNFLRLRDFNLKDVHIFENSLKSISPEIGELTSLEKLYLGANQFSQWPSGIENLTGLVELDLSADEIKQIPSSISCLAKLQILHLNTCKLSSIPDEICSLLRVRKLEIWGNQISSLPNNIGNLENLEKLFLNDNQLTVLPGTFSKLTNLQELKLEHNPLSGFSNIIGMFVKLQYLSLVRTQETTLPQKVLKLTSLDTIFLGGNPAMSLDPKLIEKLQAQGAKVDIQSERAQWIKN